MLPTNYGNGTGMSVTPLLNRHVATSCRLPEPVRSSSYCHNIFLQLHILVRRPPNLFERFLYTNICVRKILYFVDRASRCKFLLITNLTHFFMYLFISSLYMFRASQCSLSGDRILLIHNLVCLVCVSDCLVCRPGGRHTKQSLIIKDDVLIQFDLLIMSNVMHETCREMK
jgi:hypothetical protein